MQIRVVLASVAAAALVVVAAVLGFIAERARSKSFVGFDGRYCVYRTTAALGCGIGAAVLLLAGMSVLSAASGCFGRRRTRSMSGRTRTIVARTSAVYLTVTLAATALFLFGAWGNAGGERARTRGRYQSVYGCSVFKGGLFLSASVSSLVAVIFGIAAYAYLQETAEPEDQRPQAVAMGQPQQQYFQPQQQAYYPAMGYPVAAPPPPYGGYGAKAPAGTS